MAFNTEEFLEKLKNNSKLPQNVLQSIVQIVDNVSKIDFEKLSDPDVVITKILTSVEEGVKVSLTYLPTLEKFLLELIDVMFYPRHIVKQLVMVAVLQIFLASYHTISQNAYSLLNHFTESGREISRLQQCLKEAKTYSEWKKIARQLDDLRGLNKWLDDDNSILYDLRMIKKRIFDTKDMLSNGNIFDLMFRIRGGLARSQFGISHESLYTTALSGTKNIIEEYNKTICYALNYICDSELCEDEIPSDAKLAFFNETRHAYGRTALLLSGGAYLGYYHLGVVKALFFEGLLPRVISGASAGSIMTAIIGTRTDQELYTIMSNSSRVKVLDGIRTDFFLMSSELRSDIARRLNYLVPQGLRWLTVPILSSIFERKILNLDTEHFKRCLIDNIGLHTFQEAFDRTGRIINITVAPLNNYEPPRLLNYLTAPHVCVWSAAAASSALPGIFDSVSLIVKEPNGQFRAENEWTRQCEHTNNDDKLKTKNKLDSYTDGSLESDLPMQQLSELFNVNHFIVSQVNPHSFIFSSFALSNNFGHNQIYKLLVGYCRFLISQCRDWIKNVVGLLTFRSTSPVWSNKRGLIQTLTQDYEGREGDVTISPWAGHISPITALLSAIKNPTNEEFFDVLQAAERNTWPLLSRIRAHCAIEATLEKCVQKLRKKITEETEKSNQNAPSTQRKGNIDRVPSFYTSRSIVNLSGLSVSDPAPVRRPSMTKATSDENLFYSSFDSTDDLLASNQVQPLSRKTSLSVDENKNFEDAAEDSLNLNVPVGDVLVKKNSSNLAGMSSTSSSTNLSDEDKKNSSLPASPNVEDKIHKTTHMASFYYKRSLSSDVLSDLARQT